MNWQDADTSASVSLDGAALKRCREEKRLTQLYVSKVVGVTTDTISRWENNRYPTMRRDNALKLAEALEVAVDELLRKPVEPALPAPPAPRMKTSLLGGGLAVILLGVLLAAVLWQTDDRSPPPVSITAERILPPYAAPGATIPVLIRLSQRDREAGFILRESLPKGWKLLQSQPPASSLDNDSGMVRWIVKADDSRDRIAYLAQVSNQAVPGSYGDFHGEIVAGPADNKTVAAIAGIGRAAVAPVMWADLDGDGRIDDNEMLQASDTVDDMAGVHIDWSELEQVWNAGGYRWDAARQRFVPVKPAEGPPP